MLLLVIVLAVLYRRKRNKKTVAPKDQVEQVSKEKDHQKTHITGHMRWDIETPSPVSLSEARAKSANAILFTSPFAVPGDCDGDPALLENGENKGVEEEESGDIMIEIGKDNSAPSSVRNLQNETTPVNCENVPYLSIGSHPTQPNNVDMKSALAKLERGMHRISTWPPTAVQWQERCKREKEKKGTDNVVTAWAQVEFKVSSNLDNLGILSNNYDENDTETLGSYAENQSYYKEVKTQIMKDLEETNALSDATSSSIVSDRNDLTFKTSFVNVETPIKDHKINPKALNSQKVNANSSNGAYNSGRGSKQKGESRRSVSNVPSDGGGKYVFVDLLHEVVQNRGRWTRDRWRQIHMNKQTPEQQSPRW
ncbi:uncharacterized protein LOC129411355 [Boleophthalmus pectinirostris]|uniref:uncharacterized protein LOC129411355 n=1 Tax=Boleophthalmus pectinirostris TaxID=150288 RepID=UPI002432DA91|nr:uncharacterized protein LOC129411355 [Boleophthalmus pectinirostris]